ncbi:MAG TPA: 50S ribosomal protein L18 [Candidatus Binataceae bacterium]|nr:50S ribosomal protein L18 [Candidatus Binataceae bacterium]
MAFVRAERRHDRQVRVRRKVRGSDRRPRLSIYRSLKHLYVQVISDERGATLAAASTTQSTLGPDLKSRHSVAAARAVGAAIAARCRELGINEVVFDRNGFLYHGRVKALADAAREAGLKF